MELTVSQVLLLVVVALVFAAFWSCSCFMKGCIHIGETPSCSTVQNGSILVDSSTIDPSVSKDVAKISAKKGAVYMDAPVSGGNELGFPPSFVGHSIFAI